MARRRSAAHELLAAVEEGSTAIAWVRASGQIEYVNAALSAWLGISADTLRDVPCRYVASSEEALESSDSAGERLTERVSVSPEARAAASALAPPPEALAGQAVAMEIVRADGARLPAFCLPWSEPNPKQGMGTLILADAAYSVSGPPPPVWLPESAKLHSILAQTRARMGARQLPLALHGTSPAAQLLRSRWELALGSRCAVQVRGCPGSGRRELITLLHAKTTPAAALVPLPCGVLPGELILATVEMLSHSTEGPANLLLLDVEQLDPATAATLADLLARLPAATRLFSTVNLLPIVGVPSNGQENTAAGELPAILKNRLQTLELVLPRLQDRTEDLPLLLQAALEQTNLRAARQMSGFQPEALERLCGYVWPGELAEVSRVLAAAREKATGPHIRMDGLPSVIAQADEARRYKRRGPKKLLLDPFLRSIEVEVVRRALAASKANKTLAARLLGLNRPRLYRRLIQLGLLDGGDSPPESSQTEDRAPGDGPTGAH